VRGAPRGVGRRSVRVSAYVCRPPQPAASRFGAACRSRRRRRTGTMTKRHRTWTCRCPLG